MSENAVEAWFERRNLTLDLAGLTDDERQEGRMLMGGRAAVFVNPEDRFEYRNVGDVVFRWGDKRAEDVFAIMLEHDDRPGLEYFPFGLATIIGNFVWNLAIQEKDFDLDQAFPSETFYFVLPFDAEAGRHKLREYFTNDGPLPRPELMGKIGTRWVVFGAGTSIRN